MSTTTLQYEYRDAKAPHRRPCEMSGLPIDKGDKYFQGAWAGDGTKTSIKALAVIQHMADQSMRRNHDDSWDPSAGEDYLQEFLLHNLSREEAKLCLNHARDVWRGHYGRKDDFQEECPFQPGDRVWHSHHGIGTVLECKVIYDNPHDEIGSISTWSVKWRNSWGVTLYHRAGSLRAGLW